MDGLAARRVLDGARRVFGGARQVLDGVLDGRRTEMRKSRREVLNSSMASSPFDKVDLRSKNRATNSSHCDLPMFVKLWAMRSTTNCLTNN